MGIAMFGSCSFCVAVCWSCCVWELTSVEGSLFGSCCVWELQWLEVAAWELWSVGVASERVVECGIQRALESKSVGVSVCGSYNP